MAGDVEVQDTPAFVADDKETVEDAQGDRGHGEEVHGRNRFPVIRKKRAPALGWLGISRNPLHPAGDSSLGDIESQHEQFAVNARRPTWSSPPSYGRSGRALLFEIGFLPTCFLTLEIRLQYVRNPTRCQRTTRLRMDEHERLLPSTPETTGEYPEDFVNPSHPGSEMLALQHRQLLPESEIFQQQASMRSQAAGEQAQP